MSRAYVGLLALDLLLLGTGACVLYGLGIVRDRRAALRYAGLSFAAGWAAYGIAACVALVCGLALHVWETFVL
jgi:hypothetical protein